MREEYGSLPMSIHDDGFGDMGFDADEADFIRDDPNIDVGATDALFAVTQLPQRICFRKV